MNMHLAYKTGNTTDCHTDPSLKNWLFTFVLCETHSVDIVLYELQMDNGSTFDMQSLILHVFCLGILMYSIVQKPHKGLYECKVNYPCPCTCTTHRVVRTSMSEFHQEFITTLGFTQSNDVNLIHVVTVIYMYNYFLSLKCSRTSNKSTEGS